MIDLHSELILNITEFLNPKQLVILSRVNKKLNELDTKNLIKKHNSKHFPHPKGKAKHHRIKYTDCAIKSIYDEADIKEKIALAIHRNYNEETDLVKGDIFCFDEYSPTGSYQGIVAIFDGEDMIPFPPNKTYLTIPSSLHVIEGNTPINYWSLKFRHHWDEINFNPIVWFDHKLVRQQCLDNIDNNNENTTFIFNNIQYYIISNEQSLTDKLSSDQPISFYYGDNSNVLYI